MSQLVELMGMVFLGTFTVFSGWFCENVNLQKSDFADVLHYSYENFTESWYYFLHESVIL